MDIKAILIKKYPLINKIEDGLECYQVKKKRYVIFHNELISLTNVEQLLDQLGEKTSDICKGWKTLIIIGKTTDTFKKKDLFYFNGVDTFAVFYLCNQKTNEIYFNDSWVYTIGANWGKIIKRFNEILRNNTPFN